MKVAEVIPLDNHDCVYAVAALTHSVLFIVADSGPGGVVAGGGEDQHVLWRLRKEARFLSTSSQKSGIRHSVLKETFLTTSSCCGANSL